MKAKMNHCTIAAFGRHRKSECGWEAARSMVEGFPDKPKGMHLGTESVSMTARRQDRLADAWKAGRSPYDPDG
jgi:hypothetical protein